MNFYDTTDKNTLSDVKNWVKIIKGNITEETVLVLIGTKIDLKEKRGVPIEAALKISRKFGCHVHPIETSSKTGENVEGAFLNVAREIVKKRFRKCDGCGEFYSKKLKFCTSCGEKAELEVITS